jgi:hypothetical protein
MEPKGFPTAFSPRKAKIEASFEPACRLCRVIWNFSYPLSDRDLINQIACDSAIRNLIIRGVKYLPH